MRTMVCDVDMLALQMEDQTNVCMYVCMTVWSTSCFVRATSMEKCLVYVAPILAT